MSSTRNQYSAPKPPYDSASRPRKTITHFDTFLRSVERPRKNASTRSLSFSSSTSSADMNSSTSSLSTMSCGTTSSTTTTSPPHIFSDIESYEGSETDAVSSPHSQEHDQRRDPEIASQSWQHATRQTSSPSSSGLVPSYHVPPIQRPKPRNQPCRNCHQTHGHLGPDIHSETCIFISAQSHRSFLCHNPNAKAPMSVPFTFRLPQTPATSGSLFKFIWSCFETIKKENDAVRNWLSCPVSPSSRQQCQAYHRGEQKPNPKAKTSLREEAPLVWLKWRAADGTRKGQTRNEKNWNDICHGLLSINSSSEDDLEEMMDQSRPVGWVTVCFPAEQMQDIIMALGMNERSLNARLQQLQFGNLPGSSWCHAWSQYLSPVSKKLSDASSQCSCG